MALPEPSIFSPGELIAKAREDAGLDQDQLLALLDVKMSRSKLSRIENDKRSPTLEELTDIIEKTNATWLWSTIGQQAIRLLGHLTSALLPDGQMELNLNPPAVLTPA